MRLAKSTMRKAAVNSMGVACLLALAGCGSSPEEQVYEAFKCAKAATLLEREADAERAMQSAAPYFTKLEAAGENPSRVAMEMNQQFQDDVPLHRLSAGGQMAMLTEVYKSDECQALYRPANAQAGLEAKPQRLTEAGAVNLAGCSVPEGIPVEDAERITCAPVEAPAPLNEAGSEAHSAQLSDDDVIGGAIAVTAGSEAGSEYKDARKVAVGDLDGDGAIDSAVLFTIEVSSGNASTQYVSVLLRQSDGSLKLADTAPVGGTGNAIGEVAVEAGSVRLKTLTLGPDDPDCCPSVEGTVEYLLHNGKLRQVN